MMPYRDPSMPLMHWSSETAALSHEQKGLLVDLLYSVWSWQPETIDAVSIAKRLRVDPRKFSRLWTADASAAFERLRIARKTINPFIREHVRVRDRNRCAYCKVELTRTPGLPNSYHCDHRLAVTLGGTSHPSNLTASCAACNLSKSNRRLADAS